MNMIPTKGLVIKEVKVGEGNKILTILTPQYGKIQAGACGVRSYKSKLAAGCSLFGFSDFVLKKGRDIYNVSSADNINNFYNIRMDIEKLSLATYFCDLICEVATAGQEAEGILKLALNAFFFIAKSDDLELIKPVFELRLMTEAGFAPNLDQCGECGTSENLSYFSAVDGSVFCDQCKLGAKIKQGTLQAMKYIAQSDPKKVLSFCVNNDILSELTKVSENYITVNIDRKLRSLEFFHSL